MPSHAMLLLHCAIVATRCDSLTASAVGCTRTMHSPPLGTFAPCEHSPVLSCADITLVRHRTNVFVTRTPCLNPRRLDGPAPFAHCSAHAPAPLAALHIHHARTTHSMCTGHLGPVHALRVGPTLRARAEHVLRYTHMHPPFRAALHMQPALTCNRPLARSNAGPLASLVAGSTRLARRGRCEPSLERGRLLVSGLVSGFVSTTGTELRGARTGCASWAPRPVLTRGASAPPRSPAASLAGYNARQLHARQCGNALDSASAPGCPSSRPSSLASLGCLGQAASPHSGCLRAHTPMRHARQHGNALDSASAPGCPRLGMRPRLSPRLFASRLFASRPFASWFFARRLFAGSSRSPATRSGVLARGAPSPRRLRGARPGCPASTLGKRPCLSACASPLGSQTRRPPSHHPSDNANGVPHAAMGHPRATPCFSTHFGGGVFTLHTCAALARLPRPCTRFHLRIFLAFLHVPCRTVAGWRHAGVCS